MTKLALVLADAGDNGWGHMNGWGGGWMWLWGVAMMVLFALVIVWVLRSTDNPRGPGRDPADRARDILAERYARGDLSTEEYRERRSELQ